MQAMIDHVAAFIVGTSIVFILAMLMFKGQDLSINAVQVDAAKGGMRLLSDMVDQDFTNMGSGMLYPNNLARGGTAVITASGTDGAYQVLEFRGLDDPASSTPQTIRYRWKAEGNVTLPNGTVVPTLLVERLVGGAVSGASFDNVTAFNVTLLKGDRTAPGVGERHLIRYVDVSIAMVSPLGPDELLEQTYWRRQFRPLNLDSDGATLVRVIL